MDNGSKFFFSKALSLLPQNTCTVGLLAWVIGFVSLKMPLLCYTRALPKSLTRYSPKRLWPWMAKILMTSFKIARTRGLAKFQGPLERSLSLIVVFLVSLVPLVDLTSCLYVAFLKDSFF